MQTTAMMYVSTEPDVRVYARTIQAGLRTLVYNDTDPGISLKTQDLFVSWAAHAGLRHKQRFHGGQRVGGYVMEWEDARFSGQSVGGYVRRPDPPRRRAHGP